MLKRPNPPFQLMMRGGCLLCVLASAGLVYVVPTPGKYIICQPNHFAPVLGFIYDMHIPGVGKAPPRTAATGLHCHELHLGSRRIPHPAARSSGCDGSCASIHTLEL